MQALDGGHQLALFGRLDAVGHADQAGARTDGLEQRQAQFHPAGGELVQIECLAVKQMQQAVVSLGAQAENPDIAGNPSQTNRQQRPIRVRSIHRKVRDLWQAGRRDRTAFIQGTQRVMSAAAAVSNSSIVLSDTVAVYFSPMNTKRESEIERQIEKLKRDLAGLGQLRPGSLSKQYTVCGSPGCRCIATPPQKHGPYYQLSFTRKGKSSTKFVRKEDLPAIRKQLKNYERMKLLVDQWIDLATELSNLQIKQNRN